MRDSLVKLVGYYDERATTYSDYSFSLKRLPKRPRLKEDIHKMLGDYEICKIMLIGTFDHI
jgi:hypothetical protein